MYEGPQHEDIRREGMATQLAQGAGRDGAPMDWWRDAVIYQIYPRSFFDSNGDGIGDLPGILARLDYVATLGVDAIWLSPFFTSPMKDFGYDVADYCAVDPIFGTLADFDRIVERAHALGLKVLIDQVWCHTSDQHPWFAASRTRGEGKADWYVWADAKPDGTPPNNWLSVFGGAAWNWEPRRRQYYLHHFLASQPKLNLRHPDVVEAVLASGEFWLRRGVDGFRLDAIDFLLHDPRLRDNPPAPVSAALAPARPFARQSHINDMLQPETLGLLRRIRAMTDRHPGTATLGEVSSQQGAFARVFAYSSGLEHLHMAYTLRLLRGAMAPEPLRRALDEIAECPSTGAICWSFGNHDAERPVSRGGVHRSDSAAFARMLMALLLALRGGACIYQGDELGLPEAVLDPADMRDPFGIAFYPEFRGRDGSRTPLPWRTGSRHGGFTTAARPWLPVPPAHQALAVDAQECNPHSPLNTLRRLLRWRKAQPALRYGELVPLDLAPPLFGLTRRFAGERLLFLCNFSEGPVRLERRAIAGFTPLSGHGFDAEWTESVVTLPAYGVVFARAETR